MNYNHNLNNGVLSFTLEGRLDTESSVKFEADLAEICSDEPVVFEKTLDKVDAEYGSLRNYLTECIGVTPEMMEILRERYLEDRSSR